MGHFRKTLSVLYSKCEKCTASVRRGFCKTSAHLFLNLDVANGNGGVGGACLPAGRESSVCSIRFILAKFGADIMVTVYHNIVIYYTDAICC